MNVGALNVDKIGYLVMTVLIILAFLFQALCFAFNNWYRADVGPFMIRFGLWEMKIYDDKNITGLDQRHHEKAEFRFYTETWKSALDKMEKMAATAPPKKSKKNKKTKQRDYDDDDPDYNEIEHFKAGESWFTLPEPQPGTVWEQVQSNLGAAEAFYSMCWLATFVLMCLFAFHQFVPNFQVTVPIMRLFTAALFLDGLFTILAVMCFGGALPSICREITGAYERSPNPAFAAAARENSDCSFSGGFSMSIFSGLFMIVSGVIAAIHVKQIQQGGGDFNFGSAAGTALNFGKSLIGGAQAAAGQTAGQPARFDWNQPEPGSISAGYDQGAYNAGGNNGEWERLQ